jgi:deoxyribose-phosphate aldolase
MSDPSKSDPPKSDLPDAQTARRALRCLDLTDLTETCTDQSIDALCRKALDPRGPVAAVCVWPQFVGRAREALRGSPVRIATVVNFPAGGEDVSRITDDVQEALSDGANEIDLVLPYGAVRRGDRAVAAEMVEAVRDMIDQDRLLKVILETGELKDPALIGAASRIAIEAGADFIKTSTGKTPVSATPEAAGIMLEAIKASGRPVGLKPSGGIRTVADAGLYLDLADRVMGPGWATPRTFRIGASSVYDALVAAVEGRAGAAASGAY